MEKLYTIIAVNTKIPNETVGIPQVSANDATFSNIIGGVFIALGGVAVLFLVVGAFRYIISNGDQAQIQRAKNTILYSVVGIVVSLLAFTIVQFVLGRIIE
jgi:uncharacterized membrane protein YidH (DUF202 family)